jgi:hypothetical protein
MLSIESLANLIKALPKNAFIRVSIFTDDTCFYTKDEKSIHIIKEMTGIYINGSGEDANLDNTGILSIDEKLKEKCLRRDNSRHKDTHSIPLIQYHS